MANRKIDKEPIECPSKTTAGGGDAGAAAIDDDDDVPAASSGPRVVVVAVTRVVAVVGLLSRRPKIVSVFCRNNCWAILDDCFDVYQLSVVGVVFGVSGRSVKPKPTAS